MFFITFDQFFDFVIFERCLFLEFLAQVLEFEFNEFWLFYFPLFQFDFDEFLLEFCGIEPHLKTDSRFLIDDDLWK